MIPQDLTKKMVDDCFRALIKNRRVPTNWFLLPNIVFLKYTKADFISVLKDPIWIKATSVYWVMWGIKSEADIEKTAYSDKLSIIRALVEILFQSGHPYADLVVKYADGLLLRAALKRCNDARLKTLANRGLKSVDYRTRRVAVKYCPTSKLDLMLKDPRREVRAAAIERLGMHNVAEKVIDDSAVDIRLGAAICLERNDIIEDVLNSEFQKVQDFLNSNNKPNPWISKERLMKIIAKLPKKQLLYHLDVKDAGGFVKDLVEAKLYETQE